MDIVSYKQGLLLNDNGIDPNEVVHGTLFHMHEAARTPNSL